MGLRHPLNYWLANDIVLSQGEMGQIIDYGNCYKIGDGLNPFSGLQLLGLDPISTLFSDWGPIPTNGANILPASTNTIIGGTLVQEGGYIEMIYSMIPANNSNGKTAKIYFNGNLLCTVNIPGSSANPVKIEGYIKCIDYTNGKAYYSIMGSSTAGIIILSEGTITGLNWNTNTVLALKIQGVVSADVVYGGGQGKVNIVSRFNPNV